VQHIVTRSIPQISSEEDLQTLMEKDDKPSDFRDGHDTSGKVSKLVTICCEDANKVCAAFLVTRFLIYL
jgi:hypothetical protein